MKQLCPISLLLGLLCGWLQPEALAQREYYNWYFGNRAGISFLSGAAAPLPLGAPDLYRDVCSVSDSAGTLQFIAEGNRILNRNFQLMVGGQLGGPVYFGYEVMALPQPGRPGRYYVFTPKHWVDIGLTTNYPPPNLTYFVVDMRRQGGLGEVVARDSLIQLPQGTVTGNQGLAATDIAAVRHANGRDMWLIIKTDQQNYLSFLLNDTGVHPQPVITVDLIRKRWLS